MQQPEAFRSRQVLPLSLGKPGTPEQQRRIPPKQPTKIIGRPTEAIDIDRLVISGAGTPGGAADWVVNDIQVDGRSQLHHKDLPGYLFGSGVGFAPRSSTRFAFEGFEVVEQGHELAVVVTYVGPNPEGVPFFGSVTGNAPYAPPMTLPVASKAPIKLSDKPGTGVWITARLQTAAFRMERIEIDNAADWIVHDVKMNGRSQFAQSGDIPGDMFATGSIDNFVSFETCLAGNPIEICVSYIGLSPEGERFSARYEGEVVAPDMANPPELRAVVEVSSEEGSCEVEGARAARHRSQSEGKMVSKHRPTDLNAVDVVDQCSALVMRTYCLKHAEGTAIEARLFSAPDPHAGRALVFFIATPDGKRAALSPDAVAALIQFDKSLAI